MNSTRRFWMQCALVIACATLLAAWLLSYLHQKTYTQSVADRLQLLNELRQGAIEQYFSTAKAELSFWSINPDILATQKKFNQLWQETPDQEAALLDMRGGYITDNPFPTGEYNRLDHAGDSSEYTAYHAQLHPKLKLFVIERGYYDVFLIGNDGDVFYTVEKEDDYATNLMTGRWRESGLSEVYQRAVEEPQEQSIVVTDMTSYGPSDGAPAIFMARAMLGDNGELLGVLAFQLPTSKILSIMNYTSGMGETGETYLVGQDNLMRSDSRFTEQTGVLTQQVDTSTVTRALQGESGVEFVDDYRGVEVLSAYGSLKVGPTRWAVMAEIDAQEIDRNAAEERPRMTGILTFFYGLSLWSVWYWRGRHVQGLNEEYARMDLDLESGDFGDSSA